MSRPFLHRILHSSRRQILCIHKSGRRSLPLASHLQLQHQPYPELKRFPDIRASLRDPNPGYLTREASLSPYVLLVTVVAGALVFVELVIPDKSTESAHAEKHVTAEDPEQTESHDTGLPNFAEMPIPPGSLGNLTPEQEQRLQEFWALLYKTLGVGDPNADTTSQNVATAPPVQEHDSKKDRKSGFFHRKKTSSVSQPSPGATDPEDKYGQTAELQKILAETSPQELREIFWSMLKNDHPDALLLRFLRARKWDIQRALAMLVSTVFWRKNEMHLDDDVMRRGEGGAVEDAQSSNATVKKEGADFLAQLRMGKSFLHGVDAEGRPLCVVRVRLHRGGEQTERSLERYTVYLIETCRLALTPPVETATIVFDMTGFTMANMDYTPVKFMIKVFEANYPESLGLVLVHKAPWIFQGIWKIIKGWLDPVVAAKVHFTNNVDDLTAHVPRSQIIKELGGDEDWEYHFVEPLADENALMQNESEKAQIIEKHRAEFEEFERLTLDWIHGKDTKAARDKLAQDIRRNYWQLDPYVRARSLYDRTGMIKKDGTVDYYPKKSVDPENLPSTNGVTHQETSADDVD